MRQIAPHPLWLGHAGDAHDLRAVLSAGIGALIDLALDEPPVAVTRELVYCRFPIVDGAGNPPWLLRTAVETTARLVRAGVPTLLFCRAGLSRSPSVAAATMAVITGRPASECLVEVAKDAKLDVTPLLWADLCQVVSELRSETALK